MDKRTATPSPAFRRASSLRLASPLRTLLALLMVLSFLLAACSGGAAQPTAAPEKKAAAPTEAPSESQPAASPASSQPKPTTAAAPAKVEKIRLGFSSTDATPMPLWIAKDQGFLLKNGLDAELVALEAGTTVVQTLIAGEIPLATVGGSGVIEGITSGAELVMIASMGSAFPYKLITNKNIKTPEDLKGKKLGVSKFGSSSDFSLRQAVKSLKLDPTKDVQILEIGTDAVRTAAMQNGAIDGTVLNPPGTTMLIKAGYTELLDMSKLTDLEYQHTSIATSKAYVQNHRDIVQRFMKAIVEGIAFEKSNKEAAKQALAKYAKWDDADGLEEAYQQYNGPNSRLLFPAPYPTRKGIELVLTEVLANKPDAKKVTVDDVIDNSFVKELEDSGYIKSLYEKKN